MTNHEINDFLAEKLFGLKITFEPRLWDNFKRGYGFIDNDGEETDDLYIFDYRMVLEELSKRGVGINVEIQIAQLKPYCGLTVLYNGGGEYAKGYGAFGDTIGEAVCRAAVAYLQEVEE